MRVAGIETRSASRRGCPAPGYTPPVTGSAGSCPLCGSTGGPVLMEEGRYVGRSCPCGTIYIDPDPDESGVDPTVDAHLESYYRLPAKDRFEWVTRFASHGRFLDVGCGAGSLIGEALDRGFTAEAVEPNAACAELVRSRYGVPVEESLIEESRLPDGGFDVIFHVDLLSHFPDPVAALEAMARRLEPGGTLCFEVGLFAGLKPRWYAWVGRPRFPAHRYFYSDDGLRRTLELAGLELVDIRRIAIAPSTVLSSLLRRLLPGHIEAVPVEADAPPARGSLLQRSYARLHYLLRYRLGAFLRLPGPQTAFVAARPATRRPASDEAEH